MKMPAPTGIGLIDTSIWDYTRNQIIEPDQANIFLDCCIIDSIIQLFTCVLAFLVSYLCCSDRYMSLSSKTVVRHICHRFICKDPSKLQLQHLAIVIGYLKLDPNPTEKARSMLIDIRRRQLPTFTLQKNVTVISQLTTQTHPWNDWRADLTRCFLPGV